MWIYKEQPHGKKNNLGDSMDVLESSLSEGAHFGYRMLSIDLCPGLNSNAVGLLSDKYMLSSSLWW